jgi:glycosyltransferase involved in cell wall biosynthesis
MMPTQRREFAPISLSPLPEQPLFSVLIRNYNQAKYVGSALESVLDQTYEKWEAIVCDDGSTDNSREVVHEYIRRDPRIRLVEQSNGGVVMAANTAFANSKGELICFLDADDLFKPSKLERALDAYRANPRCGHYADPVQAISVDGRPVGRPFPDKPEQGWMGPAALREGGCNVFPPMSGLSFRREVASVLFPIPAAISRLEDYYVSATALFLTEIILAPESHTDYRIHDANRSGASGGPPTSCLTPFDPRVHEKFVERLEGIVPFQREFLLQFYGPEIADAFHLQDNPRYWNLLLSIRILRGRRSRSFRSYSVQEMLGHIPRRAERRLWRALTMLPDPIARSAYRFWRNPSQLKVIVKTAVLPVIRR